MYRKYYSYNDMPTAIIPKQNGGNVSEENNEVYVEKASEAEKVYEIDNADDIRESDDVGDNDDKAMVKGGVPEIKDSGKGKLFGRFETDDILLLGVIFLLLADGCDDDILIIALAVIFFMGK